MSGSGFETPRRGALGAIAGTAVLPLLSINSAAAAAAPVTIARTGTGRDTPFNQGWRFRRGEGRGLEAPEFDDSGWRPLDLPHDWSVEDLPGKGTPFDKAAVAGGPTGYTTGGEGWYRKRFRLDGIAPDARVEIVFDGIYELSDVWLNGVRVGGSVSGYAPFALDLTPNLKRGGDNLLAVRVRNEGKNSRWYAGSGIYREVRLDVLPAGARIARWGVGSWTRKIANGAAEVEVTSRIADADPNTTVVNRLRDTAGRVVAEASARGQPEVRQVLAVRGARLWSPADPYLYTLETELRRGDTLVDRTAQPIGLRIVTFDPQRGMTINGAATKLRGGCVHHDNGLLGACAFRDADERRIHLLKARGFNAIRSSHNPVSRSLREACDRNGLLLIDEAFDAWHVAKNPDDFNTRFKDHWHEVVEAMVLSARNSPSVIMWSIGNEIPGRMTPAGLEWSWKLADTVHRLDPTRPVTAAIHGTLGPALVPSAAAARPGRGGKVDNASVVFLDVPGYNYRLGEIEAEQAEHPERVVYASETFTKEAVDYRRMMERDPYFLGEFLWTAMDYIGEAAIGRTSLVKPGEMPAFGAEAWPFTNANCGDLDLTGAQKPPSLARDVAWGLSPLEVLVHRPLPPGTTESIAPWGWPDELPSWTWPGLEGRRLAVRVFTAGDRVEVVLNGASVGAKPVRFEDNMRAELEVPYVPGQLEVVAYRGNRVIGRKRLRTAGPAARLRIVPERMQLDAERQSLAYVRLLVTDATGAVLPEDVRDVRVSVSGPATLVALGNGNPEWTGSLQSPATQTFRGQALAILRSTGKPGPVGIQAQAKGVGTASVTLGALNAGTRT